MLMRPFIDSHSTVAERVGFQSLLSIKLIGHRPKMAKSTILWLLSAAAAGFAGYASLADHARARRRDVDRVGWVPWPLVLILFLTLAAVFAALALKT